MVNFLRRPLARVLHRTVPAWLVRGLGGLMVVLGVSVPWIGEALGWWTRETEEAPAVVREDVPMPKLTPVRYADEAAAGATGAETTMVPAPPAAEVPVPPTTDAEMPKDPSGAVADWCARIVGPMNTRFKGRYPFVSGAEREVSVASFKEFFHPRYGAIRKARESMLDEHVVLVGNNVELRDRSEGPHLDPAVLRFLNRAHDIGAVMFVDDKLTVDFDLNSGCNAQVGKIEVMVEGTMLEFSCGRQDERRVSWRGAGYLGASLNAYGRQSRKEIISAGEWGLFHLLEPSPDVVHLYWGEEGIEVRFDMKLYNLGVVSLTIAPVRVRGGSVFFGLPGGDKKYLNLLRGKDVLPPPRLFAGMAGCEGS